MKKGYSETLCIIDRSGSMEAIKHDAIGGFNAFNAEQKKLPGEAGLTFVQFNTEFEVIHENKPLNSVKPLTDRDYLPSGGTALLDAVGKTIDSTGRRFGPYAGSQPA